MRFAALLVIFTGAKFAQPAVPEYLSLPVLLFAWSWWDHKTDRRNPREFTISAVLALLLGTWLYKLG